MQIASRSSLLLLTVASFTGVMPLAHAEQFIVTDVTYTHAADTTSDSHYRVEPASGTPANWKSPIDYSKGSAHVLLEVKTKPTNVETKFQLCFEATPTYACTAQSPIYTKPGRYEWTTPFSMFWSPPEMSVDWTKGVQQIALILKDTSNGKPQGDPNYVPTDLRVEVAILSQGAQYLPPTQGPADAGAAKPADAAVTPADASLRADATVGGAPSDAGEGSTAAGDASARPAPASDAGREDTSRRDAGANSAADAAAVDHSDDAGAGADEDDEDGCALGRPRDGSGVVFAIAALLLSSALRRRRRRSTAA